MGTGIDTSELKKLRQSLEKARVSDEFCKGLAKELAARLLRKVVNRTPVGDYSDTYEFVDAGDGKFLQESGKLGGELRRAWLTENTLEVRGNGGVYTITIQNSMFYASYVEYGHRQQPGRYVPAINKKLKEPFTPGKFMLTKSEEEIRKMAPRFVEKKVEEWLMEVFNGK